LGTGKELDQIITDISPDGIAHGLDISPVMLHLTQERTSAPGCQADARQLPYTSYSFDRLYAAYVLDLLPLADLPDLVNDFFRVLKSGGRMVILAFSEGVAPLSQGVTTLQHSQSPGCTGYLPCAGPTHEITRRSLRSAASNCWVD
jgi:ubiquinone/menaquinone biosynthesis C-methylase UbiE